MAIQFFKHIVGDSAEARSAETLIELIKSTAPADVNGEAVIVSNQRFYGYNTQEIDILLYLRFEGFSRIVSSNDHDPMFDVKAALAASSGDDIKQAESSRLFVNDLCLAIEVKSHDIRSVRVQGSNMLVRYNRDYHDASSQVSSQKYTVLHYFKHKLKYNLPVCGLIWLTDVDKTHLDKVTKGTLLERVVLPARPNFYDLLKGAFADRPPYHNERNNTFSYGYSKRSDITELTESLKSMYAVREAPLGLVTRKKMESLSRSLLDTQEYAKAIDEGKLVVLRGRAGTGKTLKLLRIAVDLATEKSRTCLLLTYNHALVSDIKRLLAFHDVRDRDENAVEIMTLHKYFYDLLVGFGLIHSKELVLGNGDVKYLEKLRELIEIIKMAETRDQLVDIMQLNYGLLAYDHVLVDEAQDWHVEERDVLRCLFSDRSIIVSDGQDQLIRNEGHCDWTSGMSKERVHRKPPERKSLRQKKGLVKFANEFARHCELDWSIETNDSLSGGRVVVINGEISTSDMELLTTEMLSAGCIGYDLLVAVPGGYRESVGTLLPSAELMIRGEIRRLEYYDLRGEKKKRDLTLSAPGDEGESTAMKYPVDPACARISYYESLRGVEAWTLIAHSFDVFLAQKEEQSVNLPPQELRLESPEERARIRAALWGLIALTRPVDTLVINVRDPRSTWGSLLNEIANQLPDVVMVR